MSTKADPARPGAGCDGRRPFDSPSAECVTAVPGASEEPVRGPDDSASAHRQAPGTDAPGREGRDVGPGTAVPGQRQQAARREPSRAAVGVLADRIAAALVHHEPGWRLPRHTALARRYNVSTPEIDAAVDELATPHLIRP